MAPPTPNPTLQGLPREVWVLAAVSFLVALGFGVMIPVLPVFARSFGVSGFQAGLVVSVFALVRLVTSPVVGRLVDPPGGRTRSRFRVDERSMLVAGVGIVAVSSAAAGLAGSFGELVLWRGLGGIGSAMFSISSMGMLLALAPGHLRGRASGLHSGGFLLGGMAGPAVGGFLTSISLQAPFFFYAGTLAASGLVAQWMLPRSMEVPGGETGPAPAGFVEATRDPRFQAAVLSSFAHGWQSHGVRSLLVPLLVVEGLGMEPRWTGIAFAMAAAVQAVALQIAGRATDDIGRRPVLVAGSLLTALMGAALAWAPRFWVLVLLLCMYGLGASMCSTSSTAALGDTVSPPGSAARPRGASGGAGRRGGTAIAGFQMAGDVGAILGPLVAGLLSDRVSMAAGFAAGSVLLVASAAMAARMADRPTDGHGRS